MAVSKIVNLSIDPCLMCSEEVKSNDKAMQCDLCESWIHNRCSNISDVFYTHLKGFNGGIGAIKYYCPPCNKFGNKFLSDMKNITEKNKELTDEVSQLKAEFMVMKDQFSNFSPQVRPLYATKLCSNLETVQKQENFINPSSVVEQTARQTLDRKVQMTEILEQDKRRNNLVIMGFSEENSETENIEKVKDLLEVIMDEVNVDFEVVGRVGKLVPQHNRPLRVKITDFGHKRRILERTKYLKGNNNYKNVFICSDLTRKQQEDDKVKRDVVKQQRSIGNTAYLIKGEVVVVQRKIEEAQSVLVEPKETIIPQEDIVEGDNFVASGGVELNGLNST